VSGQQPFLWEQHCCLPLSRQANVAELRRYARPGGAFVSVNVASGPTSAASALDLLQFFHAEIAADPALSLARTIDDVHRSARDSAVVVAFDLEDSSPLEGDVSRVRQFYDLGVRTMLLTYNRRNAAGGGCLDDVDTGLSRHGREIALAMNEVGMVLDGSHCGPRTSLDMNETSPAPMVYSHSGLRWMHDHPRNITAEQAVRCARAGGVVGIPGVRHFLGDEESILDMMVRHVVALIDLVGPAHVGLATDYVFDQAELFAHIAANPGLFPTTGSPRGPGSYLPPEGLLRMQDALTAQGLPDDQIEGVLGGNFRRVAAAVWR
jgi:membrane dipeptidase